MRTRRGLCYPKICRKRDERVGKEKRKRWDLCRSGGVEKESFCRKKIKPATADGAGGGSDLFDRLPDDLVVCILCKLSSVVGYPADFVNVLMT